MGWEDSHLYRFQIGGDVYGGGGLLSGGGVRTRLSEIVLRPGGSFLYEYDFGDQWDHEVLIEDVLDPAPKNVRPACTGGQRACPPEDCGGP